MKAKKYFSIFFEKNLERNFWSAIFEHENNVKKNITVQNRPPQTDFVNPSGRPPPSMA